MKSFSMAVTFVAILLIASVSQAATINASITVDKGSGGVYIAGETVSWTAFVWASSGDNSGVSLVKLDVLDDARKLVDSVSTGETFTAAQTTMVLPGIFTLTDSSYGTSNGFSLFSPGSPLTNGGGLVDIDVQQLPAFPTYNVGNTGTVPLIFAKGSFIATIGGLHTMTALVEDAGANYWVSETPASPGVNPLAFENAISGTVQFTVTPEPMTLTLLGLGAVALFRRRS